MSSMVNRHVLLVALLLAGCRDTSDQGDDDATVGESGLPVDDTVVSLSSGDLSDLCEWATDVQGGAGTETECGDFTVTVAPASECIDDLGAFDASCPLTVGEVEECMQAIAYDPCTAFDSAACAPIFACAE
jgi:hypothetical protein